MNCKNCNSEVSKNYCSNCGEAVKIKRINGHYIIHEIQHVLHFERGILYTIREISLRPGENIRLFIKENRTRLVKPIIFIILTSLIYTLISHFFHIEDKYIKHIAGEIPTAIKILGWLQANYGYMNILTGIFIAVWLKVFFKKYGYNFFELLIMLCYVLGVSMIIFAFFAIIEGFLNIKVFTIAGIFSAIYLILATSNFFEKNKIVNYFKAFVCYLLGMITFFIILFAAGITIDIITKH